MRPFLVLHLAGPMQAWGEVTVGDNRPTTSFPTASGVLGILACAIGIHRSDLTPLVELHRAAEVAVRVDSPGVTLWDYHTTLGTRRADRGWNKDAVVSRRSYLFDAAFTAVLAQAADDRNALDAWAAALRAPVFPLYLGRRSCAPAVPVLFGGVEATDFREVVEQAPGPAITAPGHRLPSIVDAYVPGALPSVDGTVRTFRLRDRLIGPRLRAFGERDVTHVRFPRATSAETSGKGDPWFDAVP